MGEFAMGGALADIDGDNDLDLGVAIFFSQDLIFRNDGGTFTQDPVTYPGNRSEEIEFADLDGDGDQDMVQSIGLEPSNIWLNNGTGTFSLLGPIPSVPTSTSDIELLDLNFDGEIDLTIRDDTTVYVLLNNGNANFTLLQAVVTNPGAGDAHNHEFGDLDGDGDLDLVAVANAATDLPVTVFMNVGAGATTFVDSGQDLVLSTNRGEFDVEIGDLDSDGDLDLYVGGSGASGVWTNNGNGLFSEHQAQTGSSVSRIRLHDIDGDGDLDVVAVGLATASSRILLNNGNALFTDAGISLPPGRGIRIADFNCDGASDLVIIGSFTTNPTTIIFGR